MPNNLVHTARAFVCAHHYSGSWPAVRFAYGLFDTAAPPASSLVGVLALGIPTQAAVLTSVFARLTPYEESLELSRLVLLNEVSANAETWLQGRAFRLAAARGVRGIVARSSPPPRHGTWAGRPRSAGGCGASRSGTTSRSRSTSATGGCGRGSNGAARPSRLSVGADIQESEVRQEQTLANQPAERGAHGAPQRDTTEAATSRFPFQRAEARPPALAAEPRQPSSPKGR
ncbi:Mom family adenine methylcarbamoylation protein [Streptomyces sp. NPDC054804]